MLRKIIFPVLLCIIGVAVLVALGTWQVQRLNWKSEILDRIELRIAADPVALPISINSNADAYLPVTVSGNMVGAPVFVLVTTENDGAGYRFVSPFQLPDNRIILADLGFVSFDALDNPPAPQTLTITGNLLWPDEVDEWTPAPDPKGIWFARDAPAMAQALGTSTIMVVAREITPDFPSTPMPVGTAGIPNDHLNYAITWYSLALVWLVMSGFLIARTLRPKED